MIDLFNNIGIQISYSIESSSQLEHYYGRIEHFIFFWEVFMSETLGLFLVIGFPLILCICIWLFGKFSVEAE